MADYKASAPCCFVKSAHMPADGYCLGRLQAQKTLNQKHGFFSMSVWELVFNRIKRLGFPASGFRVFDISGAHLIKLRLAHIVQQSTDGKAFHAVPFFKILLHHRFKDAQAMHYQTFFTGAVILCAGRRRKKIGALEPVQKLLSSFSFDIRAKQFLKFLLVVCLLHRCSSALFVIVSKIHCFFCENFSETL